MKNKVVVVLLIILIIGFSAFAFYFWYNYFLKLNGTGNLFDINKKNDIVTMVEENKIYATFKEGSDIPIDVEGYKFRIENKGSKDKKYDLIFTELEPSFVNDGCTDKTVLKAVELSYQLYYDNFVISEGRLDQISGKIFESRNIASKKSESYELKVWLNSSSSNNEGKHYHYKVSLKVHD